LNDVSRFDTSILVTLAFGVLKDIDAHSREVSDILMVILLLLYGLGIDLLLPIRPKLVDSRVLTHPRLVCVGSISGPVSLLGENADFSVVEHLYTVVALRLSIFVIVRHPINFNLKSSRPCVHQVRA
jgi:uncharacterized membrane protein YbjE (DUF340 family)